MSQDQLTDMQPSDRTSDTARANAPNPTPTLRESIERTLVTYGGHAGNPQARMNLDNRIAELESLLSDRIREARVEEIDALYARADHDLVLRDKLDDLYKLRYANMGGSNVFTLDRLAALQEKRNDT